MSSRPLVSVIMPVYNAGDYLPSAIRSILGQTLKSFELLIIDDGSTDGCVDAAKTEFTDERIKFFRQNNQGKPSALNHGLDHALGQFVAIMDADDEAHPNRLARLVSEFEMHPHVAIVFSGYDLILHGKHVAPISLPKDEAACKRDIDEFGMPSHDPTLMVRKDIAVEAKYAADLLLGEGLDFIFRVGEKHPMRVVPEILYSYRIHGGSVTRSSVSRRLRLQNLAMRRAAERRGLNPDVLFPERDWDQFPVRTRHEENGISTQFIRSVRSLVLSGDRRAALKQGIQCSLLHPFILEYNKALIYAILPRGIAYKISPQIG